MKLQYIGCEVDEEVFDAAYTRILEHVADWIKSGWLIVKKRIEARERASKGLASGRVVNAKTPKVRRKKANGTLSRDSDSDEQNDGESSTIEPAATDFLIPPHNRPDYYDENAPTTADEEKIYDCEIKESTIPGAGKFICSANDHDAVYI